MTQIVKNLPVMQETQVISLGWEDPLEKGTATHSSTGEIHELCSPWDRKESDTTEQISLALSYIIEAEASILWPPYVNSQLIGKYPDVGKD